MTRKQMLPFGLASVLFLLIFSSGYAQTKKAVPAKVAPKTVTAKAAPKASATDIALGKQLLSKNGCMACHKLDVKLVGPAYVDVAKKYPATAANYTYLANKIITGGSGVWGQIAMTPHPEMTITDAKKIVAYILSIK